MKANTFLQDEQGETGIGKAFGIMLLFVFIAILSGVVIAAINTTGADAATTLLLNLLPFVFVAIGILLALREAGVFG